MSAVRWTGCEPIHVTGVMPIRIRTHEAGAYGCNSWKQRHKSRIVCERSSRVMRLETAGAALMRIGLNIVRPQNKRAP